MKIVMAILMCLTATVIMAHPAAAQGKPIQLALFNPVQIVPETESISGFRLSLLYGRNANMSGFDWGLVTSTTGNFTGVQWTLVGMVNGDFEGWQNNLVSIVDGNFKGLQMGAYNSANFVNGLQFGLFNTAGSMKGIQLGLLNFIREGGWMPFFPIVNWGGI